MVVRAAAEDPITALLKTAEKKYNLNVGPMGQVTEGVKAISTGNIAIDYAIGVGGFPMGRTIEVFGMPSSGKTTVCLMTAIRFQKLIKAGGNKELGIGPTDRIVYYDYEQAMDPEYATSLGLDLEHPSLLFTQPDTLEEGANFALASIKTGLVRLSIFDSVAAMVPSVKAEADIGKPTPMVQAKLMKDFGVNLNPVLANYNSMALFINHAQEKIDMGGSRRAGMPPLITTPGGNALKFFCSVRLEFKEIRKIKGNVIDPLTLEVKEIPVATDVQVKVVKNKVAAPYKTATVRVRFGRGFDNFWTALQILMANKKIMYQGGMYYFHVLEKDDPKFAPEWMNRAKEGMKRAYIKGENNVFDYADQYPEWREELIKVAEHLAATNKMSLAKIAPMRPELEDQDEDGAEEEFGEDEDLDAETLAELDAPKSGNRIKI